MESAERELFITWYQRGYNELDLGGEFSPPDNRVLRGLYIAGWTDRLNNDTPDQEEILRTLQNDAGPNKG
jgi:hypothetical protein